MFDKIYQWLINLCNNNLTNYEQQKKDLIEKDNIVINIVESELDLSTTWELV